MTFPDDLCIGDTLLYNESSVPDTIIDLKTGDTVAHVEGYVGDGISVASRNGIGVNAYPFRFEGLVMVRRLKLPFVKEQADRWFETVKGLPYGWAQLAEFVNVDIESKGLICSVFWDLYLQHGGAFLFAPDYPATKIAPRDFKLSPNAITVYAQ